MSTGAPISISIPLLQELAIYERGRSPVITPQPWVFPASASQSAGGPPAYDTSSDKTAGVSVRDEVVAYVGVRLHERQDRRQAWYQIEQAVSGQTYGIGYSASTVTGWTVGVPGVEGDISTTRANLLAALEGSANFTGVGGTAELLGDSALKLGFPVSADEAIIIDEASQTSGAGAGLIVEATQVYWRLWGLPLGRSSWSLLPGHVYVSRDNELLAINCAGWERLYVEVVFADGAVLPLVGPCVLDDRRDAAIALATSSLTNRYGTGADGVLGFGLPSIGDGDQVDVITTAESSVTLNASSGIIVDGLAAVAPALSFDGLSSTVDLELFVRHRGSLAGWVAPADTKTAGFDGPHVTDLFLVNGASRLAYLVTSITSPDFGLRSYQRIDWRAYHGLGG